MTSGPAIELQRRKGIDPKFSAKNLGCQSLVRAVDLGFQQVLQTAMLNRRWAPSDGRRPVLGIGGPVPETAQVDFTPRSIIVA